jgi:hypothetical protein
LKIHLNNLDLIWICESPIAFVKNIECWIVFLFEIQWNYKKMV